MIAANKSYASRLVSRHTHVATVAAQPVLESVRWRIRSLNMILGVDLLSIDPYVAEMSRRGPFRSRAGIVYKLCWLTAKFYAFDVANVTFFFYSLGYKL